MFLPVMKNSKTYEHINPEVVGNHRRVLISDLSGKSNILYKTKELGIKIKSDNPKIGNILSNLKTLENEGYEFEGADASFEILVKKSIDKFNKHFELISARTISEKRAEDEDSLAYTRYNVPNRSINIILAKNWDDKVVTDVQIDKTAFHEVGELLMMRLRYGELVMELQ